MNIKIALQISQLHRKMSKDLDRVAKTFGDNTDVTGDICIHYRGVSVSVFDAAITKLTKYERRLHNVLIRSKLNVSLLLD